MAMIGIGVGILNLVLIFGLYSKLDGIVRLLHAQGEAASPAASEPEAPPPQSA